MTTVYYTRFYEPLKKNLFDNFLNKLPCSLHDKILKYKRWEDRHASLFGKLLLLEGLKELYEISFFNLDYSMNNKPYLRDVKELDFNISHTNNLVVCVLSKNKMIGVDAEEITNIDMADFDCQFTKTEWSLIKSSANTTRQFFSIWTKKEALLKSEGSGLKIPLNQFDVTGSTAILKNKLWHFISLDLSKNHVVHACSDHSFNIEKITMRFIDFYKVV